MRELFENSFLRKVNNWIAKMIDFGGKTNFYAVTIFFGNQASNRRLVTVLVFLVTFVRLWLEPILSLLFFSTRESSPKNENLFWPGFKKYSTIFDLFWTPYPIGYTGSNPSGALSLYRVLFRTSRENPCWSHNRSYNRENAVTEYHFRPLFMIIKLPRVSDA